MAHNEDRKDRGPYRKQEEIAFWYPVSHEERGALERVRKHHEKTEGYAPPPFQMLGRIIRSYDDEIRKAERDHAAGGDLSDSEKTS